MHEQEKRIQQAHTLFDAQECIRKYVFPRRIDQTQIGCDIHELTFRQVEVLHTIHDIGKVTLKALAETLDITSPSMSAMIDRLVEMGMVSRKQGIEDRREVIIYLTDKGQKVLESVHSHLLESFACLLEVIGPELAQQWCDTYIQIMTILEETTTKE